MLKHQIQHIIISRTDKIGDVILTLPMAGVLKQFNPEVKITFLGNTYTKAVIESSMHVTHFLNWDEIKENASEELKKLKANAIIHVFPKSEIAKAAKLAGIPTRIGTSHRIFHWFTCNNLVHLGRKHSQLHEAQLNLKLLEGLRIKEDYPLNKLRHLYGWHLDKKYFKEFLEEGKFNLILHTKSKGSAREWPIHNYYNLIKELPSEKFNIILTGTEEEKKLIEGECPEIFKMGHVKNAAGKLNLGDFIKLINSSDGLVACSTGPLHIAAACSIYALGLYPPIRPMHPGRWAPIGERASFLVKDNNCNLCRKGGACTCLSDISAESVKREVLIWEKEKRGK